MPEAHDRQLAAIDTARRLKGRLDFACLTFGVFVAAYLAAIIVEAATR